MKFSDQILFTFSKKLLARTEMVFKNGYAIILVFYFANILISSANSQLASIQTNATTMRPNNISRENVSSLFSLISQQTIGNALNSSTSNSSVTTLTSNENMGSSTNSPSTAPTSNGQSGNYVTGMATNTSSEVIQLRMGFLMANGFNLISLLLALISFCTLCTMPRGIGGFKNAHMPNQ